MKPTHFFTFLKYRHTSGWVGRETNVSTHSEGGSDDLRDTTGQADGRDRRDRRTHEMDGRDA